MMLSTKGRYAVMAMVDLAMHQCAGGEDAPVTLSAVSERQEITLSYLEQLFMKLRRAELVQSVRGPGGGYLLAEPAAGITIAAIIGAVEEPVKMTRCGHEEPGGCLTQRAKCLTHDLWAGLERNIDAYLNGVTLADVCGRGVDIGS